MKNTNKYTVLTQQHITIKSNLHNSDVKICEIKSFRNKLTHGLNYLFWKIKRLITKNAKKLFIIIAVLTSVYAPAQSTQDKINKANYDLYRANQTVQTTNSSVNNTINTAGNSVNTIKDGANKVIGWLSNNSKKEEKQESENSNPSKTNTNNQSQPIPTSDASCNRTAITINSCDFNTLRDIANSLTGNSNIKSIEKSFNTNIASITLTHSGSNDSILDFVDGKFPNRFNIIALQTGIINLALK